MFKKITSIKSNKDETATSTRLEPMSHCTSKISAISITCFDGDKFCEERFWTTRALFWLTASRAGLVPRGQLRHFGSLHFPKYILWWKWEYNIHYSILPWPNYPWGYSPWCPPPLLQPPLIRPSSDLVKANCVGEWKVYICCILPCRNTYTC